MVFNEAMIVWVQKGLCMRLVIARAIIKEVLDKIQRDQTENPTP